MSAVDLFLLNAIERGCRAFQRLTGRTSVWLAFQATNLSIIVYFVWAGMYLWGTRGLTRTLLAAFCGVVLWGLSQTLFRVSVEAHELNAYRRVAKGLRNPRRLRDAPLRIPFLTLSAVLIGPVAFVHATLRVPFVLIAYSLVLLTTAVLYLLACDPLPPCRGRLRDWFGAAARARVTPAESPATE